MLGNHVIKYQNKSSDIPIVGPFSCEWLPPELSFRTRFANPEYPSAVNKVFDVELEEKILNFS